MTTIVKPGKTVSHHCCGFVLAVGDERRRATGVGGLMPKPRNESAASMRIAVGDRERAVDDDRPERVREDVPEHDPQVARAGGLRRLDVLLLAQREEDAAHDARDPRPEEEREDDRHAPLTALTEQRRGGEQDGEQRQRQHEVGEAHQDVVDPAAVVAGDRADDEADDRRDDGDEDADLHPTCGCRRSRG